MKIGSNTEITTFFHRMFSQISTKYIKTLMVRNYHHMLQLIYHVLCKVPEYIGTGLVGFPINVILD